MKTQPLNTLLLSALMLSIGIQVIELLPVNAQNNNPKIEIDTLKDAHFVPYFQNGRNSGMRIFAIGKNSVFVKVGLQSGDIISKINGISFDGNQERFFTMLKPLLNNDLSYRFTVEHNGVIEEVSASSPPTVTILPTGSNLSDPIRKQHKMNQVFFASIVVNPYFRNNKSCGAKISAIKPGSVFEKVGLKAGDVVLAIDDTILNNGIPFNFHQLTEPLLDHEPLKFSIVRNGERIEIESFLASSSSDTQPTALK
jgi:type II secretory pathway component PulC